MATFTFTDDIDLVDATAATGTHTWKMLKGDDYLLGGSGNDTIYGGWGDDFLDGRRGADEIHGGDGHDLIVGGAQLDRLYGENGDDILEDAYDGLSDRMLGGAGDDRLITDGGWITSGSGHDTIFINPGAPIHLLDFHAEDRLAATSADIGEFLAKLDRNDDRWLGEKDAGPAQDGFQVSVLNGNLDLEINGHHVILHDMVKASFDFLT